MKPMLAAKIDLTKVKFPVWVSAKLDGIRCIVKDSVVLSRTLKPIPNKHIQDLLGRPEYNGLDGELIAGDPTAFDVYLKTNSIVMSHDKDIDDIRFMVFDRFDIPDEKYSDRYMTLFTIATEFNPIVVVPQVGIPCVDTLKGYADKLVGMGFEGAIVRDANAPYKYGRSTVNQGYLLKYKQFSDSEAEILSVEELMVNDNVATVNELGQTARSTCKDGLTAGGTLGAFVVRDIHSGVEFKIGTGLSQEQRQEFWNYREYFIQARVIVKYKFFAIGVKDKPRHPVFIGFRDKIDL